ncbi:SNF2 family protein [Ostertagia ostertagi]
MKSVPFKEFFFLFRVTEDIVKAQEQGSQHRSVTPRTRSSDRSQASPSGRLSPIEVKVDDESATPSAPTNSLLSVNRADFGAEFSLQQIASAIQKKRRDDELEQERAQQRAIRDGKRVCASIAKMVREFWMNVDKVVEHRAQEILEAKKRKALDAHMAFIVGEADKLSSIVQEGLTQDRASKTPSVNSRDEENDDDFCASESESDDEVTIEREEAAMQEQEIEDVKQEVSALSKDADQDMDDFLASLPPEYLASLGLQLPSNSAGSTESPADSEGEDDSRKSKQKERSKADKIRSENDDGIEEVAAKRPKLEEASDEDSTTDKNIAQTSAPVEEAPKTAEEDEVSADEEDPDRLQDQDASLEGNGDGRGMLESVDYSKLNSVNSDERQQELANIAEAALKFQPKGYTLETTQVKTAVPFLIRGTLREYQMVGLDWLVTLYEKNLNGILADEMGLGKTIQTIALLAHLACCESIWGPHLIIVPTSVILNWEMELKKWCPAFKILTYFGTQRDRAEKRRGWSKPNAFHVCITSYKTVTTDIRAFKMKAWQYLILDEAQNIKNFKSQRWQALLNVRARRRLLLTGTPLQNSLMELWSLMHFLMPAIFASHDDFKDWFSNPLTGMMDGSVEFNAPLVQQLHKVLRPFILRRLKSEVEKQLPKKTEHVIKCPLSKRQRYLYDDFMSRRTTRENLKSGNVLSVLNIVMQLRKCCNHPNLFEQRSVQSPMCLHTMRVNMPGLIVDLDEKVFGRDLPEFFDLRKRFTGVTTSTVGKVPLVKELAESNDARPPIVPGFRLNRPITSGTNIPSAAHSSEIASVVDVSAAELQRAGFAQNEMVLVVRDGEDIESLLGSNAGAPIPMRVRVNDGRLVLDTDGMKQNGAGAKLCQVVTNANGEKTLREVSNRLAEHTTGGNAPVPVSQVANPAPAAVAAMPGGAASTALPASPINALKSERTPYGQYLKNTSTPVHHLLRCTTAVSKVAPLTVSTATSGFHYTMQNGGVHECSEMSDSIVDLSTSLSPPLKRRRISCPLKDLVSGEFADLVPVEVVQRMEENNRLRLRRIVERFECQQRPFYSKQLLSLLRNSFVVQDEQDEDNERRGLGTVKSSASFDVRESLNEWVREVMERFWIWVNPAVAGAPALQTSSSGRGYSVRVAEQRIAEKCRELLSLAHPLTHTALVASQLHFPELRLIEYDCGKLQALARLLRRLYALKHRCLIFTQMSRMLDVLQAFLSYHGYQYFRLDGTTGIEQRQAMMERFNADSKIFCFILSTRSGGVGVNLTGADTVIFYDSDWNPTMDAQAQDRCHRIGQTRNVTIFRLISERTIEENILRKANQKRRLGEMAIDDAGFTPEFFKQSDNIRDLFDGDVEVGDIDIGERPKSQRDVEKAMAVLEDEQDVTAAKLVLAETKADIAEFDETRNVGASENSLGGFFSCLDSEDPLDEKYIELISQLKPIERYAVNFLEAEYKPEFEEEVREAEAVIEQKREDWVRAHNQALSNGDANNGVDENSVRLDDDFYGNGMLLDEVRSRRRGRVSASAGTTGTRAVPSRHSSRLATPQVKPSSPPRKTLSGRRVIAPNSLTASLSSSHSLRSSSAPTARRSAAQTAARSAVRKATARVSARRNRSLKEESDEPSSPTSSSPTPANNEMRKRRGRPSRKSSASEDAVAQEPPSTPVENTAKQEQPPSPETVKQEIVVKTKAPPVVSRSTATLTSASFCVRPATIVGSVLTTPAPPSQPHHPTTSSSPFKTPIPPQRFPVRTLSRHSQLSLPHSSSLSSITTARASFQSSPMRLPVRVLQSPPSTSRQSSHPVGVSVSPLQSSPPLLVRRANTITRVSLPVFAYNHGFLDEVMPMWTPFPTPPLSDTDNDIYFDDCLDLLYDRDFMPEEKLPSEIYELHSSLNKPASPVKQPAPPPAPPPHNTQQSSSDAAVMSLLNALHNPPNSYTPPPASYSPTPYSPAEFDQYMQGYNAVADNRVSKKERRALPRQLEQKGRELMRPVTPPPAVREEYDYEGPEWNIIEDQALLTAIRNEELMCHSFERMKTSLRYNWEYISGFVNRVTRFYRSPRQCSIRYQMVVRPRESGQLMVVDPLTKKPRKVPLTSAEIVHLRKGRVSTDLQYAHDAERIRESSMIGRLRLIDSLAEKQNSYKCARRPIDQRSLEPSGRLPPAQESRLAAMNIRFPTGLSPQEILSNLEEKRMAQEAAKKKLAEQQANNERPSRMPIVISVPQLVLPSPPAIQQSMAQDLTMNVMPQSHSPVGGMRRTASHPSAGVALGSSLQHAQGSGSNTQHNYVVVSQDSLPPSSRMQFVTRTADGMAIGQGGQPVYRSISNTSQTKRTPPTTPSLSRVQGSYMTNVQTVSGNSQLFQPGANTVGGAPRGRVMQRPAAPRMFVQQAPQSGDRSYVVPQQQIRMVSTQRLPPPKRTIGQKAPMTAVMVPSRAGQPHQLRAVPRGFTQGTRIMNVVMAPSSSVATSSSSQSLPIPSTSQPGGGAMTASAPTVRHPSPFSEATGVTVKRQLLAQNRQLGPASRGASPQTVAQVVIAPPQQTAGEEPSPSTPVPTAAPTSAPAPSSATPSTSASVSASISGSAPAPSQSSQGEDLPPTVARQQTSSPHNS